MRSITVDASVMSYVSKGALFFSFSFKRGGMEAIFGSRVLAAFFEYFNVKEISLLSPMPRAVTMCLPLSFVVSREFLWECSTMSTGTIGVVVFSLPKFVKFFVLSSVEFLESVDFRSLSNIVFFTSSDVLRDFSLSSDESSFRQVESVSYGEAFAIFPDVESSGSSSSGSVLSVSGFSSVSCQFYSVFSGMGSVFSVVLPAMDTGRWVRLSVLFGVPAHVDSAELYSLSAYLGVSYPSTATASCFLLCTTLFSKDAWPDKRCAREIDFLVDLLASSVLKGSPDMSVSRCVFFNIGLSKGLPVSTGS